MKFEKYYEELKQLDVGKVLKDEPLYKHTTYRVGGCFQPGKLCIGQCHIVVSAISSAAVATPPFW